MAIGGDEDGNEPALGLDPRVAIGTAEEIAASPQSYTGHYLKQVLKRRPSGGKAAKRPAEAAE